jgi:two-component system CheB/CheR fusion protein
MSIGDCCLDVAAFHEFLALVQLNNAAVEDYKVEVKNPRWGSRTLLLNGQPIHSEGRLSGDTLITIHDVTDSKHTKLPMIADKRHSDRNTGTTMPGGSVHALGAQFLQIGNPAHSRGLCLGRLAARSSAPTDLGFNPDSDQVVAAGTPPEETAEEALNTHRKWREAQNKGYDRVDRTTSSSGCLEGGASRPAVFVVEDEEALREAMCELFQEEGWTVEAYPSGEAFLAAYQRREGCLVLDVRMPGMSGLELLERLREGCNAPPTIMITGHADVRLAVQAMKAGATAVLEKPVPYDELVINIERALDSTQKLTTVSSRCEGAAKRLARLTLREKQVVEMVIEGNSNKQIAYILGISQRTVETHRANAMKKVGVRTLSELIHLAIAASATFTNINPVFHSVELDFRGRRV